MEERDNIIKSAKKIFHILEVLTNNTSASVSELSKISGYTMSTIQRIVNTLVDLKYVKQDPETLKYSVSYKLYALGQRLEYKDKLIETARPYLKVLAQDLKETVNIGVIEDQELIYIDKLVSKEPLRIELSIGGRPFIALDWANHRRSQQHEPGEYQFQSIPSIPSAVRPTAGRIGKIRERGYGVDDEEYKEGLYCITAVPILSSEGKAIAAITFPFPVPDDGTEKHLIVARLRRQLLKYLLRLY